MNTQILLAAPAGAGNISNQIRAIRAEIRSLTPTRSHGTMMRRTPFGTSRQAQPRRNVVNQVADAVWL